MAKKFRNTKARKREIENFSKIWKQTQNKVYYRRKTYGIDFKSSLPIQSKREINDLSTKEIQKINRQLKKINEPKADFFKTVTYKRGTFSQSKVDQINSLDEKLLSKQSQIDTRDDERYIIIGRDTVSQDTVLSQRLMKKKNLNYITAIKPYDFNQATSEKALDSAIQVRENRLDPEWHRERREIMKENYINSFIDLFNDDADEVVEKLKQISADDFYDLYWQFEAIDFSYVPSKQDKPSEEFYEEMQLVSQILDDYLEGKINTRGKVFN